MDRTTMAAAVLCVTVFTCAGIVLQDPALAIAGVAGSLIASLTIKHMGLGGDEEE